MGVGKPGGDLGGINLGLPGGGVLVIAGSVAVGAAGPVEGDNDAAGLGEVACGGQGAAGTEAGECDADDLGGVLGDGGEHEVLSVGWSVPGLARLGLGEGGGDQEARTGVATAAASCPAVTAVTASPGNRWAAILDPHTLKVSRFLDKSRITSALN